MYGKTFRKRPLFHVQSISSEVEDDKHSVGRFSQGSKKSGTISLIGRPKSMAGSEIGETLRHDSKWLKMREYLLLLIEACLSLAAYVIRERNLRNDEYMRLNITNRQADIYFHYTDGHGAWVSLIIGVLGDSYFGHYTMALFSVIIHFVGACLVFMEDTIRGNQHENPYAELVRTVCIVALVLITSTDFTRLVYGLQGMTNRRAATIRIFIFLHFWVSSYSTYGGIMVNVFAPLFNHFQLKPPRVGFVLSGVSLFLFVYLLYPETETHWKEQRGLGCEVVGCLFLATYYKIFKIQKRGRRGFFDNTEGTFTKATISRTKEILLLYALLLPTSAITLTVIINADIFYESIIRSIKTGKYLQTVGLKQLARSTLSIGMLISYFGLWPLMTLLGIENKNTTKFIFGHLLAAASLFYAAMLTKTIEPLQYPHSSGFVRVFNTREEAVTFIPEDVGFTKRPFIVNPKKGVMVAYPCSRPVLFPMRVAFNETNINYTMYLSVMPYQTIGYMIDEPPEVIRIRGPLIPLQEGPPGTNAIGWSKVYIYNTATTLEGATIEIKYTNQRKLLRKVEIQPGIMTTIALEPATYDFSIFQADIKKTYAIQEGALYGLMIYPTVLSREMTLDTVRGPNTESGWALLGMYFLIGLANGVSYPSLRAIIYTTAPHGLMSMSFAFLSSLEGMSSWFMYIGFRTWHCFITGNVLFAYAAGLAVFVFLCMFVMFKYKDSYA